MGRQRRGGDRRHSESRTRGCVALGLIEKAEVTLGEDARSRRQARRKGSGSELKYLRAEGLREGGSLTRAHPVSISNVEG